jgi:pimeloyl-ACP methyl ester carboxylesterase
MHVKLQYGVLNYQVSGEGQSILLLHGWGASSKTFEPVHKHLEKHFKVYSLDFPGFGESEEPPEQWGVDDYMGVLREFITKLNIENPILVGHSFGGRVIIKYTSKYGNVKKIILTGGAGIKPKRKFDYYLKVYFYKTCKKLLKLPILNKYEEEILDKMKSKLGSADYKSISGVMQQTLVKVVNEDLRHLLPDIKAPTLLVWGENDTATPVADGQLMEKMIPNAGLVVLKNAAHYAYLEQLHQFLIIIDKFLEEDREVHS